MILWHVRNDGSRFHIEGAARSCAVRRERLRGFDKVVKSDVAVASSLSLYQIALSCHFLANAYRGVSC